MVANLLRLPCIRRQRGFTLIELAVVAVIVTVLAVVAVPRARNFIIDARAEPGANDMMKAVSAIRASRQGAGTTAYLNVSIAELGTILRQTGSFVVTPATGTPTSVAHKIASGHGTPWVAISPENIGGVGTGDSFNVVFHQVDMAACVRFTQILAAGAIFASVRPLAGSSPAVIVKNVGAEYVGSLAQTACDGPTELRFVFR